MNALMVSQIRVTDMADFQAYLAKSKSVASKFGAQLVFSARFDHAINGAPSPHGMIVAARFPDLRTLRAWYESDEYKELIELRESGSDQLMGAYEEMA